MYKFIYAAVLLLLPALSNANDVCQSNKNHFQISELSFDFEFENIKSLNILNGKSVSASIEFNNGFPGLLINTTDEQSVTGGLSESEGYKKLNVNNLFQFFSLLKRESKETKDIRKVFNLEDTNSLEILERNGANVYYLKDNMNDKDIMYIERKNDPRIIMIVSNLNDTQRNKLLDLICL